MAESVISFALEQLATVIQDEARLVLGVEVEIEKLTTTLTAIQAVLNDAEKKQFKDKLVKIWLEEFHDAAYDMDDVLDKWNYEILKSRTEGDHQATRRKVIPYLHFLCSCFSKVASHHNIASKIKEIREKLDWIDSEKSKYSFTNTVHSHETNKSHDKRPINSSLIDASQVYGRVSDKEIILSRLLGESRSSNQQEIDSLLDHPGVIAIVAMGGMGKTTLAQLVVNDDRLKVQFEKTMWVCVSHRFDLTTITKTIIQEVNNKVPESSFGRNDLHHVLRDSIKDKRFLLVLDDVWTDNYKEWEPLKIALEYGAPGSRILVTTRNDKVAKMMHASYTHPLGQLSNDECLALLCRIALKDRKQEDVDVLKGIAIEISKKCKGLPLAAKALGGLLHFKVHAQDWKTILKSEIWELEEVEQGLLLSYYDLPSPLKRCLAYCSIFPKDHRIEKDVLIKQWMAQGFLKCSTKKKEEMEMVGEEYLCNLANRSFFQDFRKGDCNENIVSFKMHDLIHDLAQFLMKSESHVMLSSNKELFPSSNVRHFTLVCDRDGEQLGNSVLASSLYKANSTIRTLQVINGRESRGEDISSDFFIRYRCLRVLSLSELHLTDLSSEMNKLIHLRYLDLNNNDFEELPEALTTLYNLQTLILEGCELLCKLPSRMECWKNGHLTSHI